MTASWVQEAGNLMDPGALGSGVVASVARPALVVSHADSEASAARREVRAVVLLAWADGISVGLALVCAALIQQVLHGGLDLPTALASVAYVPLFMTVMACYGLYRRAQRRLVSSSLPDFGAMLHSLSFSAIATIFVSDAVHRVSNVPSLHGGAVALAGLLGLIFLPQARSAARRTPLARRMPTARVLIVGSGHVAGLVVDRLARMGDIQIVGSLDDDGPNAMEPVKGCPRLGGFDRLLRVIDERRVNHVLVAFTATNEATLAGILRSVPSHVRISVVPRMFDLLTVRSIINDLRGLPLVDVAPASLGPADRFVKRALDVAVSGLGLLVLSPLLILIAIVIKATSRGPVLFSQMRTGRGGEPFAIKKFRTMYAGAERMKAELENEVDGPLFKVRQDPRVTPFGRLLRKTSLDELPQLLNVLKGDMSLVGPRPFVVAEAAQITDWASRRFDVRPGMTGLWQVSGRNDLPFDELCRLDYAYVASWSLWWDLSILCRTPAVVRRQDGAY